MSIEQIVELAARLGKEIGEHERCRLLRAAEAKLREAKESQENMHALNEQARKIQSLEADGKPVEVDDKRRLGDLQKKVRSDPILQELAKVEADMVELMSKVNRAIQQGIGGPGE